MKQLSAIKYSIAVIVTGIALAHIGCTPKYDNTPLNYYYLPQDVKDVLAFKKGTFWVYQDSITMAIDTQRVDSFRLKMDTVLNNSSALHGYYEGMHCFIHSNKDTSLTDYYITKAYITNTKQLIGTADKVKVHGGDQGVSTFIVYPFTDTTYLYNTTLVGVTYENDAIHNVSYNLSQFLHGQYYANVLKIHHSYDVVEHHPDNVYYAAHIGVVRREVLNPRHVWNLVSYHIAH